MRTVHYSDRRGVCMGGMSARGVGSVCLGGTGLGVSAQGVSARGVSAWWVSAGGGLSAWRVYRSMYPPADGRNCDFKSVVHWVSLNLWK